MFVRIFIVFFGVIVFFLGIRIFRRIEFIVEGMRSINFLRGLMGVMVGRVIFIFAFWFLDLYVLFVRYRVIDNSFWFNVYVIFWRMVF